MSAKRPDWRFVETVSFVGDRGWRVDLGFRGYEFKQAKDFHDLNWLPVVVRVEGEAPRHCEWFVLTTDLETFRSSLRFALDQGWGEALLESLEPEFGLAVRADRSDTFRVSGAFDPRGEVGDAGAPFKFAIARSALEDALRAVDAVLSRWPRR